MLCKNSFFSVCTSPLFDVEMTEREQTELEKKEKASACMLKRAKCDSLLQIRTLQTFLDRAPMHVIRVKNSTCKSMMCQALGPSKRQTIKPFKTSSKRGILKEHSAGGDFICLESEKGIPLLGCRGQWLDYKL